MYVLLYLLGVALRGLSILSIIPLLCNLLKKSGNDFIFLIFALASYAMGYALSFFYKPKVVSMRYKQVFFFTSIMWITISLFSAIPFLLELDISYTDALFESVSAITTTGASIIPDLSIIKPELLLWRSLLQWIGGIGFIAFTLVILPVFHIKRILLFQSESSGWPVKLTKEFVVTARKIISFYLLLTLLCCCGYFIAGMNFFQAINHAFTTVSTGGYSTFNKSLGHYNNYYIYWVSILFMVLSSIPFALFVKCINKKKLNILINSQVKFFIFVLLMFWLIVTFYLLFNYDYSWFKALTESAFSVTSVVTTTGYVSQDYSSWGNFVIVLFCLLLIVGGCSGSSAGGIKMFRIQIFFITFLNYMKKTTHPYTKQFLTYNNKEININIISSLIGFTFIFMLCIFIITLLLCLDGLDLISSFSSASSALANVGPGLGKIVGPTGSFSGLSDFSKWVLSVGMLLGRLEVTTLVMIFVPYLWGNLND